MNVEPEEGQDLQSSQPPSDPEDNDDDEDYKRPLRAPKNRENIFGEIPGTFCGVLC